MKKNQKSIIVILVCIVIVCAFSLTMYINSRNKLISKLLETNEATKLDICDSSLFKTHIAKVLPSTNIHVVDTDKNIENSNIWRDRNGEFFTEHPVKSNFTLQIEKKDILQLQKIISENTDFAPGYIPSKINSFNTQNQNGTAILHTGFSSNKGEIAVVNLYANANRSINLQLSCLKLESIDIKTINEVSMSNSFLKLLNNLYKNSNYSDKVVFVFDKHQNNIIHLGVSSLTDSYTHNFWMSKKSGSWDVIFVGQDQPDCKILEKNGIESGVSCSREDIISATK